MSRVFLSMTDEEVCALDAAREKVGMTKSQYVRYLMSSKKRYSSTNHPIQGTDT